MAEPVGLAQYSLGGEAPVDNPESPWNVGIRALNLGAVAADARGEQVILLQDRITPREFARRYGAGNIPDVIANYVRVDPLVKYVRLIAVNMFPFSGDYNDPMIPPVAYVYSHLKCRVAQNVNISMRLALAIGEAYAPHVPDSMVENEGLSRAAVLVTVQHSLRHPQIIEAIARTDDATYTAFKADARISRLFPGAVDFPVWPPTDAQITTMLFPNAMKVIYYLSLNTIAAARDISLSMISNSYTALAKRGQVTDDACTKISEGILQDLNITVVIDSEACQLAYNHFLKGVNETNAASVIGTLYHYLPDVGLRLRLTLEQSTFSGLTSFVLVGRAMRTYRTFNWAAVDRIGKGAIMAFARARAIVRGNPYYGFSRNLGAVRATLYRSATYCAIQLLVKLGGEQSLKNYGGISRNTLIPGKARLDELIADYVDTYFTEPEDLAEGVPLPRAHWVAGDFTEQEAPYYHFAGTITEEMFA